MNLRRSLYLSVLIEKEEDHYSARCLEFNIASEGDTIEGVKNTMTDLIYE